MNGYIVENMLDHACQCEEVWCWCKGSTFTDSLVNLAKVDKRNEDVIEEILARKDNFSETKDPLP